MRTRWLILIGTLLTFVSLFGFGRMGAGLTIFYLLCLVYMVGYILSGPVPHQIMVSHWYRRKRGTMMGIVYVGVGLVGAIGGKLVKWLTAAYGWQAALQILGALILLAWPITLLLLKDKPSDIGQNPDGDEVPPAENKIEPSPFGSMMGQSAFWLLLAGSVCSIGSIGAVNMHMKLVFRDQGFVNQAQLNDLWATASPLILISSIGGRLAIGWLADAFSKKYVMLATYFIVAGTIPILLLVRPDQQYFVYIFSVAFGFAMGADYMLIPLMAAEQFGVNTLARAMAIILPANTIGQFWFPYAVSQIREASTTYWAAMMTVFAVSILGALAIALLPKHGAMKDA